MQAPNALYKYRYASSLLDRDIALLEANCFYAPRVDQLNDPMEAYLVDEFSSPQRFFPDGSVEFDRFGDALQSLLKRRFNTGVFSLSATNKSELLWAHYAESHKGYCIEYDASAVLNNFSRDGRILHPVVYGRRPPVLGPLDAFTREGHKGLISKMICQKSTAWEYEEEFRILIEKPGVVSHHPDAIRAIHFGIQMRDEHKEILFNKLKGRGVQFGEMRFRTGTYEMERIQCGELTEPSLPQFSIRAIRPMISYDRTEIDIDLCDTSDLLEAEHIAEALGRRVFSTANRHVVSFYVPDQKDSRNPRAIVNREQGRVSVSINSWT